LNWKYWQWCVRGGVLTLLSQRCVKTCWKEGERKSTQSKTVMKRGAKKKEWLIINITMTMANLRRPSIETPPPPKFRQFNSIQSISIDFHPIAPTSGRSHFLRSGNPVNTQLIELNLIHCYYKQTIWFSRKLATL